LPETSGIATFLLWFYAFHYYSVLWQNKLYFKVLVLWWFNKHPKAKVSTRNIVKLNNRA